MGINFKQLIIMKRENLQRALEINQEIEKVQGSINEFKKAFNYGGFIPEMSITSQEHFMIKFPIKDEILRSVILDTTLMHLETQLEVLFNSLEELE